MTQRFANVGEHKSTALEPVLAIITNYLTTLLDLCMDDKQQSVMTQDEFCT